MRGRSRQRPIVNVGKKIVLFVGILGIVAGVIAAFLLYRRRERVEPAESIPVPTDMMIELEIPEHILLEQSERTKEEISEVRQYEDFLHRMEAARTQEEIEKNDFQIIEDQIFSREMAGVGEVVMIPALDAVSKRLVLFFAETKEGGSIVFRTERLETNGQFAGQFRQGNREVAAVSFPDIDQDGKQDVVLVTVSDVLELDAGFSEKVGDVLFQGTGGFYQDWRLSKRINQYSMNKSVRQILSFVEEGDSTEAMDTAATREELIKHGFVEEQGRSYWVNFEKLGKLLVVPGHYRMAEYHIFMIYLINEDGNVVWNFQPMGEFENLYEFLDIDCRDIDGDGLKDITVLARYTYDTTEGEMLTEKDYTIYYQRTGGFLEDSELKSRYMCGEETTMEELVVLARAFWGWGEEND